MNDKEKRCKKEEKRLRKIFGISSGHDPPKRLQAAIHLIERAAFYHVALEELEKDIEQNGSTEFFQQSENQPGYERKRPAYDQYLTSTSQYQKIIKQLTDLLPKTDADTDDLMSYIGGGKK